MSMLNRICFIAVAVWMAAWTTSLHAADKWDIGFNEPFVAGYMQLINQCEQCPTNSYPASAAMMAARVGDLAGNHHVGIYREIIPVQALRPSPGVNRYDTAIDILSVYSNYNVNLVITFGLPIPAWMSVTGDRGLVMPESDTDWTTLKNTLSWEMGNFVKALWDSPRINKTWLQERVYIEGFNEFDSLLTLSNQRNRASPQRAADLQNGIQTVLNYYGIPVKTSMPSVVGVYAGYVPTPTNIQAQYMADYYAAGGTGVPNAHIYVRNDNAGQGYVDLLGKLRLQVQAINAWLPTSQRGRLIIGETGAADRLAPYCTSASAGATLDIAQRDQYYAAVAADPTINAQVDKILFWRMMNLPVAQVTQAQIDGCEAFYGVVNDDNSSYKNIGLNLFNYLEH